MLMPWRRKKATQDPLQEVTRTTVAFEHPEPASFTTHVPSAWKSFATLLWKDRDAFASRMEAIDAGKQKMATSEGMLCNGISTKYNLWYGDDDITIRIGKSLGGSAEQAEAEITSCYSQMLKFLKKNCKGAEWIPELHTIEPEEGQRRWHAKKQVGMRCSENDFAVAAVHLRIVHGDDEQVTCEVELTIRRMLYNDAALLSLFDNLSTKSGWVKDAMQYVQNATKLERIVQAYKSMRAGADAARRARQAKADQAARVTSNCAVCNKPILE